MRSWHRHRVPFIEQGEHSECGLAAAAMILAAFGHPVTMDELRRRYGAPRGGLSLANIVTVLSDSGIRVRAVTTPSAEALKTVMTPCILHWDDNHFVVLDHYAYGRFRIADPANGRHAYTPGELAAHCSGAVLIPQPTNDGCATIPIRPRSGTVSILTGFLRRNMPAIGLSLLFSLVVQGLTLIVPAGTGYMVDHGSLAAQSGFPPLVATMLLASLLVYYAVGALNTVMLTRVQVRFGRYLSRRYMTGVLDREFPFFVNRSGGDLIYRANLVMVVEQIVTGSLPSTVVSMVFLVVYLIMMIAYSVPLTMLTLTLCAAVLVVSVIYSLRNRTLVERATVAQADVQRAFIETFSGIETVKSLNLESHCYDRWSARLGAQLDYQTRQGRLSALLSSLSSALVFVLPLCVVAFGMTFVGRGTLALGAVVGFMSLASAFVTPFSGIVGVISQIMAFATYMRKICEMIPAGEGGGASLECDEPGGEPGDVGLGDGGRSACGGSSGDESGDGILERLHATGVGYSYTVFDAPVLSDVDCDIRKGDKIAIVGPTGSGKSTLLKLLAGLIEPVCGTVTINGGGCRIYDADSRWKAGRLAYVHQESTVFNETLRDNITLHRPWLTDDDIVRACEVAGINEGMMDPVVGLDAMVSERGMNLSGGQRQKVAIARAVVGRPDFLLMDEPTSALDNDTERHVMTALLDSDNACIVVAHRLASIRDFDRIHVMDHGQIVESGTHDELLQAGGLYSRLYRQE